MSDFLQTNQFYLYICCGLMGKLKTLNYRILAFMKNLYSITIMNKYLSCNFTYIANFIQFIKFIKQCSYFYILIIANNSNYKYFNKFASKAIKAIKCFKFSQNLSLSYIHNHVYEFISMHLFFFWSNLDKVFNISENSEKRFKDPNKDLIIEAINTNYLFFTTETFVFIKKDYAKSISKLDYDKSILDNNWLNKIKKNV